MARILIFSLRQHVKAFAIINDFHNTQMREGMNYVTRNRTSASRQVYGRG